MEINGVPLHPLVVHAAVVFAPLASLVALGYALVGRWRDRLRWPMVALAVVTALSVGAAYLSGDSFLEAQPELRAKALVKTHEERAGLLLWTSLAFGVVAIATGWFHARSGGVQLALRGLLVLGALGVLVTVVLTGDAGARAVWSSLDG